MHQCIIYSRLTAANEWTFESEHGRHVTSIGGPIIIDDADAMEEAVMQHLGIAILPEWNAADGIRSGQLENILPEYSIAPLPLHAVYPEMHWMSPRARSFLDLLIKRANRFAPPPMQPYRDPT
jgi:DNA-binding transcriptional LysR family regulator